MQDQSLELKNRTVNEIASFVMSDSSVPVQLVATKVWHDQVVGYLAVPSLDRPSVLTSAAIRNKRGKLP